MSTELETLVLSLKAELDRGLQEIRNMRGEIKKVGEDAKLTAKEMTALGVAAAGLVVAVVKAGGAFGEFESRLNKIQAVSNTTVVELDKIKTASLKIGADTEFSAMQAADGFLELGKAGFTVQEQMNGIAGTISLASAAGVKVGEAAGTAAGIIRGFGLEAGQASMVADQLAQAANSSAVDVSDLSESMKFVAPIARASGQSLSEVNGILAHLGNNMIVGGQAGTTLRSAIVALQKPSDDSATAMHSLGISIQDNQGHMLPLTQIIAQFRDKMQGMSDVQKSATMATVFGTEALSGMMSLLNAAPGEVEKLVQAQDNATGAAKRMADTMNRGAKFQIEQLKGSIETLAIQLGDDLSSSLGFVTKGLTDLTNAASAAPTPVRLAAEAIVGLALSITLVAGAIGGVTMAIPTFTKGFATIGSALLALRNGALAAALAGMIEFKSIMLVVSGIGTGTLLTGIGLIAAGVAALSLTIYEGVKAWQAWKESSQVVQADIDATNQLIYRGTEAWKKWGAGGKLSAKELKDAITGMKEYSKNLSPSDELNKLQGLPALSKVKSDIKAMQDLYDRMYGVKRIPTIAAAPAQTPGLGKVVTGGGTTTTTNIPRMAPPKADPFASAENAYTLAMAKVGAYGGGKKGELEAAKKLLNDLQYIQNKGKLSAEEQHQLELKILDAKGKINAASEKSLTPEEKKAKLIGDIHDKTQLLLGQNKLENGTLEEQRTILQNQVTELEKAGGSAKEILDARLALKGVEDEISGKVTDTTNELSKQAEAIQDIALQVAQVGAGFAASSIKGDTVSAGDGARGASGLAGSLIGMLGGPAGVAIGTQIGNIVGQLIGAAFDRQDQDREDAKDTAEYWQESAEEAAKEWKEAGVASDDELLEKLKKQWNALGPDKQMESMQLQKQIAEVERRNAETQKHAADIQIKAAEEQRKAAEVANKLEDEILGNNDALDSFAGDMGDTLKRTQLAQQLKNHEITQEQYDKTIAQMDADKGLQGAKDRAVGIMHNMQDQMGSDHTWTDNKGVVHDTAVDEVNRIVEGIKNGTIKESGGNKLIEGLLAAFKNSTLSAEGIVQSIKDTFSQFTQTNPLPVQDVSLRNLFAVGPAQRYFVERKSEITLRIDGKADTDSIIKAISTPAGREAVFGNNQKQGAIINIVPAQ